MLTLLLDFKRGDLPFSFEFSPASPVFPFHSPADSGRKTKTGRGVVEDGRAIRGQMEHGIDGQIRRVYESSR